MPRIFLLVVLTLFHFYFLFPHTHSSLAGPIGPETILVFSTFFVTTFFLLVTNMPL